MAIKAQALADFIAEFTFPDEGSPADNVKRWTIQTDDSSAQKRRGVGVVITTPDGEILKYGVRLRFPATNNEAEYKGILMGLRLGKALGVKNLLIQSDLKLVIEQIKGEYKAKEERMQKYLRLTKHLTREFDEVEFIQVPRNQNTLADEISKLASSEEEELNNNLAMKEQIHPSIEEAPTHMIQNANSWMLDDTNRIVPPGWALPPRHRRGQEDKEKGSQIHGAERHSVQKRLLHAIFEMCRSGRSQIHP